MNREAVLDIIYGAKTIDAVEYAQRIRSDYLKSYSDDDEILESGEMLLMTETALRRLDGNKKDTMRTRRTKSANSKLLTATAISAEAIKSGS